jgi:hypothetical protein
MFSFTGPVATTVGGRRSFRMLRPSVRVFGQTEHHVDAAVVRQAAPKQAAASAAFRVVVRDVVEEQRRAVAGALREAHDGAELYVPVDLRVDLPDLPRRLQCADPTAKVAKGDRCAFPAHVLDSSWPQTPGM